MLFLLVWVIGFAKNALGVIGDNRLLSGCFRLVLKVIWRCFSLTVSGGQVCSSYCFDIGLVGISYNRGWRRVC